MVNHCALKRQAKIFFAGKPNFSLHKAGKKKHFVESSDQFRHLEVREMVRNAFEMTLRLSDYKVLQNIASVLIKFFRFRSDLLAFFPRISYYLNFCSLRNLIKQLFHSRLLDMRLVIANSYPTPAHGIIVNYSCNCWNERFENWKFIVGCSRSPVTSNSVISRCQGDDG